MDWAFVNRASGVGVGTPEVLGVIGSIGMLAAAPGVGGGTGG